MLVSGIQRNIVTSVVLLKGVPSVCPTAANQRRCGRILPRDTHGRVAMDPRWQTESVLDTRWLFSHPQERFPRLSEMLRLACGPTLFGGEERKHILVVSNDPDVAQHIKEALESSGECQVTGCSDAYDLGMMAATLHPEVIIVDMAMPGHNDCGLCCRIVGDPVIAHVKVLGLVDSLSEEEEERSWRRGVSELLVKPLEGQDVYQHVCSTLEGKS